MPRKIKNYTKADIIAVPLPQHGDSYTVISHQSVIDYAYTELANAGFGIVSEEYRATGDGQIAQGIYKLNYNNDPELSMMFTWTNSYNKQVRFKCAIGAYINKSETVMICGEIGSWSRKHTGTADEETIKMIQSHIVNAHMYYNQLVSDKNAMVEVPMTKRKQAQMLGILFAEYEVLTTEQASFVRQQMSKPSFSFDDNNTLWAFYNYVTSALQASHPRNWLEDQRILHHFISSVYNFEQCSVPAQIIVEDDTTNEVTEDVVDPLANNYGQPDNQTNLLVQIAEETGDDSLLKAQYPVTPDDAFDTEAMPEPTEEEIASAGEGWGNETTLMSVEVIEEAGKVFHDNADAVIQYTDPVGNTFEAPVVDEPFTEKLTEAINERFDNDAQDFVWGNGVTVDTVNLNEDTKKAVIVSENITDDDFSFDLNFDEEIPDGDFEF